MMQVFRLRDKLTGKYLGGGHGTHSGMYPTLKGLKSALKTSWKYPKYPNKYLETVEVVTFDLVETDAVNLKELLQESSNG
jgi:hypothetical protein